MGVTLPVVDVPLDLVDPNPWNPNKQSERQFAAEVESIRANGFVLPCVLRKVDDRYQIIDGEHRWKAINLLHQDGITTGAGNLPDILAAGVLPSVVLDIPEPEAKRLTIILNETRGRADLADLADLIADLNTSLGEQVGTGLPYSEKELAEFVALGNYTWDTTPVSEDDFQGDTAAPSFTITAQVDEGTWAAWNAALAARNLTGSPAKEGAGHLITHLLTLLETS